MNQIDRLIKKYIDHEEVGWDSLVKISEQLTPYKDGAVAERLVRKDRLIVLRAILKKGESVVKQQHPGIVEHFHVITGFIKDNVSGIKLVGGQTQVISPGILHQHKAIENSEILVVFKKID